MAASNEGFPSLEPAFIIMLDIDPGVSIGATHTGSTLNYVHVNGGTMTPVPGYKGPGHSVGNGKIQIGGDWISADNDGARLRLDVKVLLRAEDDTPILFKYTGITTITDEIILALSGSDKAATTSFGSIVSFTTFETGSELHKDIANVYFVGGARFVVQPKGVSVEYRLSRVVV